MTLRSLKFLAFTLSLNLVITLATAADLQRGLDAYQSGDYATALAQFEPLAEQGDSVAQFSLGVMYDNGEGVIQDYEQAFSWFQRAAEQGHPRAQGHLGRMYFLGRGVDEDLVQAYIWFNLAVAQGDDRFGLSQKSRKLAEEKMTDAELKEAQEKSWDYMKKYVEPFRQTGPDDGTTQVAAAQTSDTDPPPEEPVTEDPPEASTDSDQPTPSVEQVEQTQQPLSVPEPIATPTIPDPTSPDTTGTDGPDTASVPTDTEEAEPEEQSLATDSATEADPTAPVIEPPSPTITLNKPATPQSLPQSDSTELSFPTSPFPQTATPTPAPTEATPTTTPENTEIAAVTPAGEATDTETTDTETTDTPPSEASPAATSKAPTRQPVRPTPDGRFRVQLASLNSAEKASNEQQRLQRRHSSLLGELTFTIQSASLEQGVFHRVQAGPLSFSGASSLCEALKQQGQACVVVNR